MYSTMYKRTLNPPTKKMILNTADRSSGVVFLSVSGFLGKSGTLVKTKGGCCPFSDDTYSLDTTLLLYY